MVQVTGTYLSGALFGNPLYKSAPAPDTDKLESLFLEIPVNIKIAAYNLPGTNDLAYFVPVCDE
jgi:hypothetical protein